MERGILYFYTATILNWQHLLQPDAFKNIIVNSLHHLSGKNLIILYGFVVMPNHIHLLLEVPEAVEKERDVQHSFMSFTGHEFKKELGIHDKIRLQQFYVNDSDRQYQFWERNSNKKAVSDSNMAGRIVNYIHSNPLQDKWNLSEREEDYFYSSALFYKDGGCDFGMLNHYMDYFNRR